MGNCERSSRLVSSRGTLTGSTLELKAEIGIPRLAVSLPIGPVPIGLLAGSASDAAMASFSWLRASGKRTTTYSLGTAGKGGGTTRSNSDVVSHSPSSNSACTSLGNRASPTSRTL